jgi:PASTA domain
MRQPATRMKPASQSPYLGELAGGASSSSRATRLDRSLVDHSKSRVSLGVSARPTWGQALGLLGLLVALASLTVAGLLATAAVASADTLTVTVGPNTVAEGQTATVTASGQASDEGPGLDVLISPGSVGCAPDYAAEYNDSLTNGDVVDVPTGSPPSLGSGPFSFAVPVDTDTATASETTDAVSLPAGPYLLCGYLYTFDPSSEMYTTYAMASAALTLRNPNDAISMQPVYHVTAGSFAQAPIGYDMEPGTTEASLNVAAYPTRLALSCDSISIGGVAGGESSFALSPGNHTVEYPAYDFGPGTYTLCAQIYAGPDDLLLTTAQSTLILVAGSSTMQGGSPTGLKCHVPDVVGERLARARKTLTRDHCSVGNVVRRSRPGQRQGFIVSQSVKPDKPLPDHARINLVVAN